ncbi:hypothetical protein JKP88DRAFT_204414 [Tribonema minus]|uniref:DUF3172 domain-containing protein n=1 Tax=Tribonema minus TaxID=303371 RepID=A0A836CMQ9_9STRA|nr:hypothetical protein JKP88DRAFT_204414 [Tribonema minus]
MAKAAVVLLACLCRCSAFSLRSPVQYRSSGTAVHSRQLAKAGHTHHLQVLSARLDDEEDDEEFFDDEFESERPRRQRRREPRYDGFEDVRTYTSRGAVGERRRDKGFFNSVKIPKALLAGIFVLGIGTGVTVDSAINTNPKDLASRDAIDRNAPNPGICQTYGSSAMVVDERVFVTFNPFSIYVAQADVKPGCVLRQSNFVQVLKRRNLINDAEVETCKGGMNTWAFVGDLNGKPQLSCVYQSDDAQNEFVSDPKIGLGEDVYDDDRAAEQAARAARAVAASATKPGPQAQGMQVEGSQKK